MKKSKYLLICFISLLVIFLSLNHVSAFAQESTSDGEIANESEILTESEETFESEEITASEPKYELTEKELTELVNSVLSDAQKDTANKVTEILASKFGWSETTLYVVVGLAIIVLAIIVYVAGIIIKDKSKIKQLKEQVLVTIESGKASDEEKATYKALVSALSPEEIEKTVKKACEEVEKNILAKTNLSSETIGEVLKKLDIVTAYNEKQVGALKILAQDAGKTAMVNELSDAPEVAVLQRLEYENKVLNNALGESAVNELLK